MRTQSLAPLFAAMFALFAVASSQAQITVEVVNETGQKVFVKFIGNSLVVDKNNQALAAGASASFKLTSVSAGRIYFSYGQALSGSKEPDGANTSDPNYWVRFDKAELTYVNGGKCNLTAVDHYAIPMMLQTFIVNPEDKKLVPVDQFSLAAGATGNQLLNNLLAVVTNSANSPALVKKNGNFIRLLSPVKRASCYANMINYVARSKGATLTLSGTYFGKPNKNYNYSGTIGDTQTVLTMTGEKTIKILTNTLTCAESAIYTCNGAYYVDGQVAHVGNNDFYAAVYRDFVSGYNFGYIAGNYGNNSAKWWGNAPFSKANKYYNKYAEVIQNSYPGAYGFPFSDRQRHVLADLGGKINVLRITLLADNQKPTYLPEQGVLNPTKGTATFDVAIVSETAIKNLPFTFGKTSCLGGFVNNYNSGVTKNPTSATSATVHAVTAVKGYNKYDLVFGNVKYMVLVYVDSGNAVTLATIGGGGNANFGGGVLYLGGLQTLSGAAKQMSHGSLIDVSVSDFFSDASVSAFSRPPTVYAMYGKKKARLKVLNAADEFPLATVRCALVGKPDLSVQNAVGANSRHSVMNMDACALHVKLNENLDADTDALFHVGNGSLRGPFISYALDPSGTREITDVQPGEQVLLIGNHFGKKAPKAFLVYAKNNHWRSIPCEVVRPLAYEDEYGQAGGSCMDLTSADGGSQLLVRLPDKFPNGWVTAERRGFMINNGVDKATWLFENEE